MANKIDASTNEYLQAIDTLEHPTRVNIQNHLKLPMQLVKVSLQHLEGLGLIEKIPCHGGEDILYRRKATT
jgi:Mn-dependent DtxR family transcriptional regulator